MSAHGILNIRDARETAGLTQEAACERCDIPIESWRAYEYGNRLPPQDRMARICTELEAPWLALEWLQITAAPLGVLPEIRSQQLPTAVLALVNRCVDFAERLRTLMRIAEDGIIDDTEQAAFGDITAELKGLIAAAYQVLYPQEAKKDHSVSGFTKRSVSKGFPKNDCKPIISHREENARPTFAREGGALR